MYSTNFTQSFLDYSSVNHRFILLQSQSGPISREYLDKHWWKMRFWKVELKVVKFGNQKNQAEARELFWPNLSWTWANAIGIICKGKEKMIISKMQILRRALEGTTQKILTKMFLTYCSYYALCTIWFLL